MAYIEGVGSLEMGSPHLKMIKPYYDHNGIQIYLGDCLEIMPELERNVDVVCYSPPYNKAYANRRDVKSVSAWRQRNIEYLSFKDDMPEKDYQEWQIQILNSISFNILKGTGSVFYNHKNRIKDNQIISPFEWLLKSPFVVRQQITWDRKGSPQIAPIRFLPTTEYIFWLTPKPLTIDFNSECQIYKEVWSIPAKADPGHPASFPVELPLRCIKAINNCEIVCDPLMGIGKTLVAAIRLGKKAIGIEIEEKYCEIATRRLAQGVLEF